MVTQLTCVRVTSFMKGQLSSWRTSSTIRSSHADSSWTPWFLPDERRLPEDEAAAAAALEGDGRTGLQLWVGDESTRRGRGKKKKNI